MSARSYLGSVRVALLDDHALVLKGLVAQLETSPSIVILGSFSSSRPFRALLAETPADVVLLDYSLAFDDLDGVALIRLLRKAYPRMKILIVSAHDEGLIVRNLLQAGADGFVAKSQDPSEIIHAIDVVMTGGVYRPPQRAGIPGENAVGSKTGKKLSLREWEVVRCLLDGLGVTQIAVKFGRSMKTISAQKSAAFQKLGVRSDSEFHSLKEHIRALANQPP